MISIVITIQAEQQTNKTDPVLALFSLFFAEGAYFDVATDAVSPSYR